MIIFYSILFYSILFYSILFYSILFYSLLTHRIGFQPSIAVEFRMYLALSWVHPSALIIIIPITIPLAIIIPLYYIIQTKQQRRQLTLWFELKWNQQVWPYRYLYGTVLQPSCFQWFLYLPRLDYKTRYRFEGGFFASIVELEYKRITPLHILASHHSCGLYINNNNDNNNYKYVCLMEFYINPLFYSLSLSI